MGRLEVTISGSFSVTLNEKPATFATDRSRALFAYLVVEADISHRREKLATLLWPNYPESDARKNLSQALARARRAIDDYHSAPPYLQISAKSIKFHGDLAELDINRFQNLVTACTLHPHLKKWACDECIQKLEKAADLYRGDFLQGLFLPDSQPFEEWVLSKREQLHQQALETFHTLAVHSENSGNFSRAREYAQRQLTLEPWQENAHRQIIRCFALEGNRSAALAQFDLCCQLLENELGVDPEPNTRLLYEQIKSGEFKGSSGKDAARHNLPASLTPLWGRSFEISQLADLISSRSHRLVTIIGEGGVGKTRLALAVAEQFTPSFSHGVWFIPVASLASEKEPHLLIEMLITAIAGEMGWELASHSDLKNQLFTQLRSKELLLILDNFEHLTSLGRFLTELLQAAPEIKILITSRFALNLLPETLFPLEGLTIPEAGDLAASAESDAVKLFIDIANRLRSPVFLDRDLLDIVEICRLVDGLPLGIEIAAGWTNHFTCQEIAHLIKEHFDSLTAVSSDFPQRHRSLRAVLEYSWGLLSSKEKKLLTQFSIFRGGFSRSAALQVTGSTALELANLTNKSLIKAVTAGRYEMHERVRQFAYDKLLVQIEENPEMREKLFVSYSQFFLVMVAKKEGGFYGKNIKPILQEVNLDLDNVRQAWELAVNQEKWDLISQAAPSLSYFYRLASLSREADKMLDNAIAHLEVSTRDGEEQNPKFSVPMGTLLVEQAFHMNRLAMYKASLVAACRAIELAETNCDATILTKALLEKAESQRWVGERQSAKDTAEKAVNIAKANGLLRLEAEGIRSIATTLMDGGNNPASLSLVEKSHAMYRTLDDQLGVAKTMDLLAGSFEWTGQLSRAKSYREQILKHAIEMENIVRINQAYVNLGGIHAFLGKYQAAKNQYRNALKGSIEIGMPLITTHALSGLALIYRYLGKVDAAMNYCQQAITQAKKMGEKEMVQGMLMEAGIISCLKRAYIDAEQILHSAYSLAQQLELPHQILKCEALLGWVSYLCGKNQNAVKQIEPMLLFIENNTLVALFDVFMYYFICYEILSTAKDGRAQHILHLGYQRVQEWGSRIEESSLKHSFFENVPSNNKIIAAWNGHNIPK